MRKPIVWASCLALLATGAFLASCDSKGSSPTSSEDTAATTTKVPSSFTVINPATGDTTLPNDVSSVVVRVLTSSKTGVSVRVGGVAGSTSGTGVHTAKLVSIPVGINRYPIAAFAGDTTRDTIVVTRQLTPPTIAATSGQPGQTDFTDSVTVQFNAVDASGASTSPPPARPPRSSPRTPTCLPAPPGRSRAPPRSGPSPTAAATSASCTPTPQP